MHIITKRRLREFAQEHPETESGLRLWEKVVERAEWTNVEDTRNQWPSAEAVGNFTVFNIAGQYRLAALVDYTYGKVFIRGIMTHDQYMRTDRKKGWKHDDWFKN